MLYTKSARNTDSANHRFKAPGVQAWTVPASHPDREKPHRTRHDTSLPHGLWLLLLLVRWLWLCLTGTNSMATTITIAVLSASAPASGSALGSVSESVSYIPLPRGVLTYAHAPNEIRASSCGKAHPRPRHIPPLARRTCSCAGVGLIIVHLEHSKGGLRASLARSTADLLQLFL